MLAAARHRIESSSMCIRPPRMGPGQDLSQYRTEQDGISGTGGTQYTTHAAVMHLDMKGDACDLGTTVGATAGTTPVTTVARSVYGSDDCAKTLGVLICNPKQDWEGVSCQSLYKPGFTKAGGSSIGSRRMALRETGEHRRRLGETPAFLGERDVQDRRDTCQGGKSGGGAQDRKSEFWRPSFARFCPLRLRRR